MPGASPTIRRRASRGPKDGTGALNQAGSRSRRSLRNATRRGQRGQSRGASAAAIGSSPRSSQLFVLELVSADRGAARQRAALQELRRMIALARLPAFTRRALSRVAADLGLQFDDVLEDV